MYYEVLRQALFFQNSKSLKCISETLGVRYTFLTSSPMGYIQNTTYTDLIPVGTNRETEKDLTITGY